MPARAVELIGRQCGLITRSQALRAGVPAWQVEGRLRRGGWSRVLPSVYLTAPGPPDDFQFIRAVHLWAGATSVVGGAAALFWQRRLDQPLTVVDVAIPTRQRVPGVTPRIVAHRQEIPEFWRIRWDGIWVARTEYAVAQLLAGAGPELLDHAVRKRWVTVDSVAQAHLAMGRGRGSAVRSQILGAAEGGAESEAERLVQRALRAAGITGWVANKPIRLGSTHRVGDIVFADIKLLVELDGFAFHTSHDRFVDDRARQNDFVVAGWTVLRFTWWQLVQDAEEAARKIGAVVDALSRRPAGQAG